MDYLDDMIEGQIKIYNEDIKKEIEEADEVTERKLRPRKSPRIKTEVETEPGTYVQIQ